MTQTLLEFATKMERRAKQLAPAASALSVNAAAKLLEGLVLATPVDTSKALSGWQIGLNTPPATDVPAYVLGEAGSTQGASADEAYQAALSVLANKKPGDIVYVSNLTPYIVVLNGGSSTQAPAGFVEIQIQETQVWLQSSAAKVNLDG